LDNLILEEVGYPCEEVLEYFILEEVEYPFEKA
jgi:hypothetical protein